MSLGIFSIDLAALINSLSDLIEVADPDPAQFETSLEKAEDVLQSVTATETIIDDVLMAAALSSAVTSVIAAAETAVKNEPDGQSAAPPKTAAQKKSAPLDEETRREIERLIKSLQTSVVHNYKSSDIIDETVSLNTIANFPKRKTGEEPGERRDAAAERKKSDERRLEMLRAELRRAMLRNNSSV
ncbi:MAG TPA: hypothetical protein VIL74_14065 [Pyrinomonadaceae bacterium]|jgi:hypothetical protein